MLFDISVHVRSTNRSGTGISTSAREKWNQERVLSNKAKYGTGSKNNDLDGDTDDYELQDQKQADGKRISGEVPSINVQEVDESARGRGTTSPATIENDGRGSEEDLWISDVPTSVSGEQARKLHIARQLSRTTSSGGRSWRGE